MRILAVIVAYRPNMEMLERNLQSFSAHVEKVLLWQNSPLEFSHPGVELAGDGTNRGIGEALNFALGYAQEKKYDWLLTMDQDSRWEGFDAYLQAVEKGPGRALFGPYVSGEKGGEALFTQSDFLITSGMLSPVSVLKELGGWRTDFKVDAVDADLVLKARSLGIPTLKVNAGVLHQRFGNKRKVHGFHVYDYPPERLYSIFRNHLILIRTYPYVGKNLKKMFLRRWVQSRIPRILLGEKGRWKKLRAIVRGAWDGLRAPVPSAPRIGLVTWFGTPNYGTNLQAWALTEALRMLGSQPHLLRRVDMPDSLKAVKDNVNRMLGIRRFWKYGKDPHPGKTRRIRRFCQRFFPVSYVTGPLSLKCLTARTDLFLCGSDQLWNAYDHFRPFEFLGFVSGSRKAAFATSVGTRDIPAEKQEAMAAYLRDFGPISMRESSGAELISHLTGRDDILQVTDPTFLLPPARWQDIAVPPSQKGPYILCYLLSRGHEEKVRAISEAAGIPAILSIPAGENPHPGIGTLVRDAGPQEFLGLLDGASLVVTDSFHGVALSANLSRDMLILNRFKEDDPASQNPRLRELAGQLGLEDRFYTGSLPRPVQWEAVQERIDALRARAWAILKKTVL